MRISILEDKPRQLRDISEELAGAGHTIVGEHRNTAEALEAIPKDKPQVVIADLLIGREMSGLRVISQARSMLGKDVRIVAYTAVERLDVMIQSLCWGVDVFICKSDKANPLPLVVETISEHGFYLTPKMGRGLVLTFRELGELHPEVERLSPKQREILTLFGEGKRIKEIATALNLSISGFYHHRDEIFRKLRVDSLQKALDIFNATTDLSRLMRRLGS